MVRINFSVARSSDLSIFHFCLFHENDCVIDHFPHRLFTGRVELVICTNSELLMISNFFIFGTIETLEIFVFAKSESDLDSRGANTERERSRELARRPWPL